MTESIFTRVLQIFSQAIARVKDGSAVAGVAFFAMSILGCLVTLWALPAGLFFYGFWAGHRIFELYVKTKTVSQKGDERLARSIDAAIRRLDAHHAPVIDGAAQRRPEPPAVPGIAPQERT